MIFTFAGSDPGDANHGYSVINFNKKCDVNIIEMGMFTYQINNLTEKYTKPPKSKRRKTIKVDNYPPFSVQLDRYREEWVNIITTYNVDAVTVERFQARGLRGKSIEAVSIMNTIVCLTAIDLDCEYELITAATWKNSVNKFIDLKLLYTKCKIPPHIIDAVFIAIHAAIRFHKLDWKVIDFKNVILQLMNYEYRKN